MDFEARQLDDLGRFTTPDPMAEKRYSISNYSYASNNPIMRTDPTGMLDGWIEGKDGVFWDENTNSQCEFETNYAGKEGFSYVSDANNPNAYSMPDGSGKLIMNDWMGNDVDKGFVGVSIEMTFIPSNKKAKGGWVQTYSTNTETDAQEYDKVLPSAYSVERYDGYPKPNSGTIDRTNVNQAYYADNPPSFTLSDSPGRSFNKGAQYAVTWYAQSSLISNGNTVVTVGWGFTIDSFTSASIQVPTIINAPTNFHKNAIINTLK